MAIVRKQRMSLWNYLREAPRDWFLSLSEDYELVDWNRVSEATSWPCALGLNVLFILVTVARQLSSRSSDMDVIVDADRGGYRANKAGGTWGDVDGHESAMYGESRGSLWSSFLYLLHVFLVLASIGNAWILFSSRRTYQLRPKDETTVELTPSCRRVTLGTRRPQWAESLWGRPLWMLWKWIAQLDDQIQGEIWELSLWEPPVFSRNLFCWYSPVQILIMSFMDGSNWYYILPLAAAAGAQSSFLVRQFSVLVKDKQILFGEVYNEYNEKFVHPRVFAPKKDAGTSTMEDWALARKASVMFGIGRYGNMVDSKLNKRRPSPPRRHTASVSTRNASIRDSAPPNPYDPRGPAVPVSLMNGRRDTGASRYHNPRHTAGHAELGRSENYENDRLSRLPRDPVGSLKVRDRASRRKYQNDLTDMPKGRMYSSGGQP
ncbi:hypothetical protein LPJ72_000462 [Coemansia sp. Benny D160-2]|nr:hypothetical protein LPJ72_000462 [Coemansia sp. Benny D160-2]